MSAHDRWLANYHRGTTTVWCANKACGNHADGLEIDTETEYGQTVYLPEECPACHSEWLDDKPDDDDPDDPREEWKGVGQ